ncbi:putative secreted protein [Wickerhamomyces ciferrii]|uniref:Secreted protein n=1 Tax=Wickerhamomyces ciferrii (strain ATCC 14091 / BCRC 22168 / CBS 111 / JCM 3599 / NBRC 0793 / NRRL Y-1031 F-60-10) TaxID=1206466 RepID=K0KP20_WICCF|nr:uncharacterized protein BN7_6634 [Wickerhamomyces ciferrii]CCH47025.1 putative secreted protein [Wickerhamomyces ciferrii]
MKLSTIFAQGLLLSGIIASPVAATPDALPDILEGPSADNSSDLLTLAGKSEYKLCFEANKGRYCYNYSVSKCVDAYLAHPKKHLTSSEAKSLCSFWCSKIRNPNDCKTNKKKFNYHPEFACAKQTYC